MTNVDYEQKLLSEKRQKLVVRKLLFLNTARLLRILGYVSTEKDAQRLDYAVAAFGDAAQKQQIGGEPLENSLQ